MRKIISKKLSCIFGALLLAFAVVGYSGLTAQPTSAFSKDDCPAGSLAKKSPEKVKDVNTYADCNIEKDESLMPVVQTILNVIVSVIGIAAVAVIVLGGVTFVTSQGDAAKVTKGKNTIIYGIVGLLVAILAFAIVNFVLSSVFK